MRGEKEHEVYEMQNNCNVDGYRDGLVTGICLGSGCYG